MLPYTPLHYLLFHHAAGSPAGVAWLRESQPLVLVMTSANPGGEPLVTGDDEARSRLGGIADWFVFHDREIAARCDDSVMRATPGRTGFFRRARGFTPRAIALASDGPATIATGGLLKNTICVTRGAEAFVSPHIGSLEDPATRRALVEVSRRMLELLAVTPERVACDRHPDFYSSQFAAAFADARSLPLHQVQHHHAHVAAVAAEHRLTGRLLGLALDGFGLGDSANGGIWGGELLEIDGAGAEFVWATSPSCRCRVAIAPLASPGEWLPPPSTGSAAPRMARSRLASPARKPVRSPRSSSAESPPRRPRAPVAGSTPPPACSASAR